VERFGELTVFASVGCAMAYLLVNSVIDGHVS
jgi:hypothetical protein